MVENLSSGLVRATTNLIRSPTSISYHCTDKLEEILQQHSRLLENQLLHNGVSNQPAPDQSLFSSPSHTPTHHVPHAEAVLFLQKPSVFPSTQSMTEKSSNGSVPTPA